MRPIVLLQLGYKCIYILSNLCLQRDLNQKYPDPIDTPTPPPPPPPHTHTTHPCIEIHMIVLMFQSQEMYKNDTAQVYLVHFTLLVT